VGYRERSEEKLLSFPPPFILPETGPQVHLDLEARFLLSRENHLICNFWPDLESFVVQSDRLWRQGQKETVTIHHIVTKNTVDEDVLSAPASKDVTQEKLIAAVKARL
jgi:hypothetical protein